MPYKANAALMELTAKTRKIESTIKQWKYEFHVKILLEAKCPEVSFYRQANFTIDAKLLKYEYGVLKMRAVHAYSVRLLSPTCGIFTR